MVLDFLSTAMCYIFGVYLVILFGPFHLFVHLGGTYGIELFNPLKYIILIVSIWHQNLEQTLIVNI